MSNKRIKDARLRAEQLERHQRLLDSREKEKRRKIDIRRKIIIGEIVSKYFPSVINLQPKLNQTDNEIEFATLDEFFSEVSRDETYTALLQEKLKP